MVNLLGENFWLGFRVRTAKTQRLLFIYVPTELARTTSDENTQLNNKLRDLEVEVAVWKQQAISSRNAQDYESKPVFRRSVAFENGVEGKDVSAKNIALCVIDGTRSVFSPNYLVQGGEGGRKAGQEIVQGITDHLANDGSLQVAHIKVSIVIYVMRSRLRNELIAGGTCTAEQFDGFFVGLNETRHLNVVEVGNKSDTDRKIEDYLQLFAGLTQTVRVFFGGGNSSHYLSVMATLETCNASSKLVILRSQTGSPYGASARIPFIMLPGLFTAGQLVPATPKSTTPFSLPFSLPIPEADEPDAWAPPPESFSFSGQRKQSTIDPTLPLYKQDPPPCNEFYLMTTCSKEGRCRYSHEYNLTDDQLATLAKNAKQSPCWFLNNDRECPFGPSCCWGHVCPFGIKCHYSLKDKCRFKGRE
ncbi:hypothetical protein EDB84DRAFT_1261610 [Lactarius hengduanensis]|nr:hypothetical protein EDB84DRAFT_1261610 [Lactarius hengduanensis]